MIAGNRTTVSFACHPKSIRDIPTPNKPPRTTPPGHQACYMWPTMLATASERFPRGGALLMGLMGTAGTLSIQFVLPIMGAIYDRTKISTAGGEAAFNALPAGSEQLNHVLSVAAQTSFRAVAILPA